MFSSSIGQSPGPLKVEGSDWYAIYEEYAPRVLDIQPLRRLSVCDPACCVSFSADSNLIATADGISVRIFDAQDGQMVCELGANYQLARDENLKPYLRVCFSPDGSMVAASGDGPTIYVWQIETRSLLGNLAGHTMPVVAVAFQDVRILVSASRDSTVRFWDVQTKQQIRVICVDQGVNEMTMSPDRRHLAIGSMHAVTAHRLGDGHVIEKLGHPGSMQSVAISPEGTRLASANADRMILIWDIGHWSVDRPGSQPASTARLLHIFQAHQVSITQICWTPDGQWLLSASQDRHVRIWDPRNGRCQTTILTHTDGVTSISASPRGHVFATGSKDCQVRLWTYSRRSASHPQEAFLSRGQSQPHGRPQLRCVRFLEKPGHGLPVNHLPSPETRFPTLVSNGQGDWRAPTLLIREVCMLKMMEDLTNKPQWWLKVDDSDIAAKWKEEASQMDWTKYRRFADFTPAMADACINELRRKADLYQRKRLIPVFDYSTCVMKSDYLAPDLCDRLKMAILPLENVPADRKDWHPNSGRKVLDLVHPSLWPLIYGRTRVLAEGTINVENCLGSYGLGKPIAQPDPSQRVMMRGWRGDQIEFPTLSLQYQWLPCDIDIDKTGRTGIRSYINNLHPRNGELYSIINGFIERSLPAWDLIYRWPTEFKCKRLHTDRATTRCETPEICEDRGECVPWNRPIADGEAERDEEDGPDDDYRANPGRQRRDNEWYDSTHPLDLPDAEVESTTQQPHEGGRKSGKPDPFRLQSGDIKSSGFFGDASGIQVIVKLANIQLTPEHPVYTGGSWHIEGQLNEHICATALFYYDCENITESRLAFRTRCDEEELRQIDYRQSDYRSISRTFAIDANPGHDTVLQDIGSVLTRDGRAVFFPNVLQHRVMPFSLADRTLPGHRKILALFLVDPAIPVISTANVPPQQPHWILDDNQLRNLAESDAIHEDEAKSIRLSLMSERSVLQSDTDKELESVTFDFCEH